MKALIQQINSELYWKRGVGWVREQAEADDFYSADAAVLFCIATEMRDTRVVLSFGDPKLDIVLHPFGPFGYERTSEELINQSRATAEKSRSMGAKSRGLLAGMLQSIAALKELRKKLPFKRKTNEKE